MANWSIRAVWIFGTITLTDSPAQAALSYSKGVQTRKILTTTVGRKMKMSLKLIAIVGIILPAELLAQAALDNLFFSPVPIGMADDSILATARNDQERRDLESAEQLIANMQNQSGEFNELFEQDPEQIQRLNRLGLAYQTLDQHEEALAIFADATALAVELYGEDTLEQIPSLEQSILSHLQLNEVTSVTEKEEFIFAIKASNYAADSQEMYTAMSNLADWYTSAYFKINYLSEGRRQNIRSSAVQRVERQVGINSDGPGTLQSIADGSIRDVTVNDLIDARLQKLDDLYQDYQESYSSNTTLSTVLEVARKIARLAYHTKQEMDFEQVRNTFDPNYTGSREEQIRIHRSAVMKVTAAERMPCNMSPTCLQILKMSVPSKNPLPCWTWLTGIWPTDALNPHGSFIGWSINCCWMTALMLPVLMQP